MKEKHENPPGGVFLDLGIQMGQDQIKALIEEIRVSYTLMPFGTWNVGILRNKLEKILKKYEPPKSS